MARVTRLARGASAIELMHERIRDRRTEIGMTKRALAGYIGVDESAMSRIERNQRSITIQQLHALAAALHTTTDWVLANEGAEPEPFIAEPKDRDRRFRPDHAPDSDTRKI